MYWTHITDLLFHLICFPLARYQILNEVRRRSAGTNRAFIIYHPFFNQDLILQTHDTDAKFLQELHSQWNQETKRVKIEPEGDSPVMSAGF
jgi:hypothetical protein